MKKNCHPTHTRGEGVAVQELHFRGRGEWGGGDQGTPEWTLPPFLPVPRLRWGAEGSDPTQPPMTTEAGWGRGGARGGCEERKPPTLAQSRNQGGSPPPACCSGWYLEGSAGTSWRVGGGTRGGPRGPLEGSGGRGRGV